MSRMYRFDLKVRSDQLPQRENDLFKSVIDLWTFDAWDVEPDGQYWATGEDSFTGHEDIFAARLAKAVRHTLGADAEIEVVATDLDAAPSTTYTC